jgi:hypothetical protein
MTPTTPTSLDRQTLSDLVARIADEMEHLPALRRNLAERAAAMRDDAERLAQAYDHLSALHKDLCHLIGADPVPPCWEHANKTHEFNMEVRRSIAMHRGRGVSPLSPDFDDLDDSCHRPTVAVTVPSPDDEEDPERWDGQS